MAAKANVPAMPCAALVCRKINGCMSVTLFTGIPVVTIEVFVPAVDEIIPLPFLVGANIDVRLPVVLAI
jgi:hypothetical protein